jgi:hypothetical protein
MMMVISNVTNQSNPGTFVVKTVDTIDAGTLVVAAKDEKVFRILDLVRQQQRNGLQALLPAVHIVPQEQVVCLGRELAVLE